MGSYGKRKGAFVKAALDADQAIKERAMSPLGIEILLHYYCTHGSDYRDGDFSAPAVWELLDEFVGKGLLRICPPKVNLAGTGLRHSYEANREALHIYVEALCDVPLPANRWEMPVPEIREGVAIMDEKRLAEIERCWCRLGGIIAADVQNMGAALNDLRALVAEVRRLQDLEEDTRTAYLTETRQD